jgi:large subunit ribosomal protein L17
MRHRKRTVKLGRPSGHRRLMLANLTCSLIQHGRITTTRAKAKAVRQLADKMMTLAKDGSLHARRRAIATLQDKDAVRRLFGELVEDHKDRPGGYTRIMHLPKARVGDGSLMSILEWSGPYTGPKTPRKETASSGE